MNLDELEEKINQEIEIMDANILSRLAITERKFGWDNSHLERDNRLSILEERCREIKSNLR